MCVHRIDAVLVDYLLVTMHIDHVHVHFVCVCYYFHAIVYMWLTLRVMVELGIRYAIFICVRSYLL